MKFGMNCCCGPATCTTACCRCCEQLKEMGYDGVEVPIFSPTRSSTATWGKRLDDLGFERTAVTIRTEADNPISPDAKVRAAGIDATKRTLDCCQALGAESLCGPYPLRPRPLQRRGPDARTNGSGASTACAPSPSTPQTAGVMLAVEYLNRFETYFLTCAADTARFINEVNHPNCRMMYDTFHANIEEKNIADAIRTAAPYTVHVHISENDRSTPGQGNVALEGNVRHAARSRLRRLDGRRSLRPGAAGDQPPPPKSGGACTRAKSNSPATRSRS